MKDPLSHRYSAPFYCLDCHSKLNQRRYIDGLHLCGPCQKERDIALSNERSANPTHDANAAQCNTRS